MQTHFWLQFELDTQNWILTPINWVWVTQTCALIAWNQRQHCTSLQNVLTLLSSVRRSLTRLSNNSFQNLKPCLSIDSLRYLLKALNQTTLRWKESTQKFKTLHKHSYFKLNVFWISQQPPSLHLLIHQIIFYHNHTIYKLFTFFFVTFPFSSFSSLIFSFFLVAAMSGW